MTQHKRKLDEQNFYHLATHDIMCKMLILTHGYLSPIQALVFQLLIYIASHYIIHNSLHDAGTHIFNK